MPMPLSVKGFPVGPRTRAPFARQRAASGMSAVTTMSRLPAWATIQSSAASSPTVVTTTRRTSALSVPRSHWLLTRWTTKPCRSATRTTSSFTGQASPST